LRKAQAVLVERVAQLALEQGQQAAVEQGAARWAPPAAATGAFPGTARWAPVPERRRPRVEPPRCPAVARRPPVVWEPLVVAAEQGAGPPGNPPANKTLSGLAIHSEPAVTVTLIIVPRT
jgi:hypothetical protein